MKYTLLILQMNNKLWFWVPLYDSIESPSGTAKKFRGCATHIGLSASKFKTSFV